MRCAAPPPHVLCARDLCLSQTTHPSRVRSPRAQTEPLKKFAKALGKDAVGKDAVTLTEVRSANGDYYLANCSSDVLPAATAAECYKQGCSSDVLPAAMAAACYKQGSA